MLLSICDLSKILGIGQGSILTLAKLGKMPYKYITSAGGNIIHFCPDAIKQWLNASPNFDINDDFLENLRQSYLAEFPDAMNGLKEFDKKFIERKPPKRYYLIPYLSKKYGCIWYVKYLDRGRLISSRWSSGTTDEKAAALWAVENRERILSEYYAKRAKAPADLYKILSAYYEENSPFLIIDAKRGRTLGEARRKLYDNFIKNKVIPYFEKNRVRFIEDIDTALLARFQNYLLQTIKPQTVNSYIAGVKMIFRHFITTGYVKNNPCAGLPPIRIIESQATGCYEVYSLKGIFDKDKEWKNKTHHLLMLLIYATGMRNSEINKIQVRDIIEINGCRFIDIPKSKSPNGVRAVPLHDFVYQAIMEYITEKTDYIFPQKQRAFDGLCSRANLSLAEFTGYTPEMLRKENIIFYSGRHFWKTLMNSEGLGEIDEYFMGHKVSSDVAKRYNRKDKLGKEKIIEKAREAFAVLDRCLFA